MPISLFARISNTLLKAGGLRRMRSLMADPRHVIWFLLAVVLGVGLGLRVLRGPQGLPYLHHWDEPQIASRALNMLKTGDLNPHFFNYGSFPIYLNLAVDAAHYLHLMGQDPEEISPPLNGMEDLETGLGNGWSWSVSHPSFYLWNRWLTSLFGALCIFGAYLISRTVAGPAEGLLAAMVVATTSFHIEHSAWVTVDVPASCFALFAAWASLRFIEDRRNSWLLASAVLAGLAASVKYTAVLTVALPLIAFVIGLKERRYPWRSRLLFGVLTLPPAIFLLVTPYAVLDFSNFIEDVGYELRHYQVAGHREFTIESGMTHLTLELTELGGNLGPVVSFFSLLGVVLLLRRPRGPFLLVLPFLHLFYMSRMVTHFHRNHVLLYPFAAVAAGVGTMWAYRRLRKLAPERWRPLVAKACVALLLLFAIPRTAFEWRKSRRHGATKDTRTRLVDRINTLSGNGDIDPASLVIEAELRFHEQDLKALPARSEVLNLEKAACRKQGILVLGDGHESMKDRERARLSEIGEFARQHRATITTIESKGLVHIERIFKDPAIRVLGPAEGSFAWPYSCRKGLEVRESRMKRASSNRLGVSISPGGELLTPAIEVPAGRFFFVVDTAASFPKDDENPRIRVEAVAMTAREPGEIVAVLEASVVNKMRKQELYFRNTLAQTLAFRVTFLLGDNPNGAQAKVWVHRIELESQHDRSPKSKGPRPARASTTGMGDGLLRQGEDDAKRQSSGS